MTRQPGEAPRRRHAAIRGTHADVTREDFLYAFRGLDEQRAARIDAACDTVPRGPQCADHHGSATERVGGPPCLEEWAQSLVLELREAVDDLARETCSQRVAPARIGASRGEIGGSRARRSDLLQKARTECQIDAESDDDGRRTGGLRTHLDQYSAEFAIPEDQIVGPLERELAIRSR